MAMVRKFGDKAGGQTEVKINWVFTAVCVKFSSGGENHIQISACFSVARLKGTDKLYWHAC